MVVPVFPVGSVRSEKAGAVGSDNTRQVLRQRVANSASKVSRLCRANPSSVAIDAGYGFGLPGNRGVLTPYTGMTLGDAGNRTVRTGTRWQLGARDRAAGDGALVNVRLTLRWIAGESPAGGKV